MLGDSPLRPTGFGRVNRMALEAFQRQGWEVAAVTALQTEAAEEASFKQFPTNDRDSIGFIVAAKAIEEWQPDFIYGTYDMGVAAGFSKVVPNHYLNRWLSYIPIEGEPLISREARSVLTAINFFTCTQYGADIVARDLKKKVDWVHHGVDEDFHPDEERRALTRQQLGWDDRFVVMYVAQNVRRKNHPRLLEAMAILQQRYKQNDIWLYDHTVPFQQGWLEGHDLDAMARWFGVRDRVMFHDKMESWMSNVPQAHLSDLYRAAELLVHPSQVEGWGLPLGEAMASGLPIATTKYAAGWEVAAPAFAYPLPVHDWEMHKSGTRYANVSPDDIAKAILDLKRDPKRRARMSAAGVEASKQYQWSAYQEMLIGAIEEQARS